MTTMRTCATSARRDNRGFRDASDRHHASIVLAEGARQNNSLAPRVGAEADVRGYCVW